MIRGNEAQRQRLREAIERLPLRPEADVDGTLDVLELGFAFARLNALPSMTTTKKKNGKVEELRKFTKLAKRLVKQPGSPERAEKLGAHIKAMHHEALEGLSAAGPPSVWLLARGDAELKRDLETLIDRAEMAIAAAQQTAASTSPKRLAPEQIAQICGQIYPELTGKRAVLHFDGYSEKRTGPFLHFLKEIYAATGIEASAEHFGRHAEGVDVIGGRGGVTIRKVQKGG